MKVLGPMRGMAVLRQTLVVAAALAAVLATLFGGLYGVILSVNRADRPPSPAALELARVHERLRGVPDADNAFVYLLGFTAHRDRSPRDVGAERASWLRDLRAEPTYVAVEPPTARVHTLPELLEGIGPRAASIHDACGGQVAGASCHQALSAAEADLPAWLAGAAWLLERYRTLIAHRAWREIGTDDHRTPWRWLQDAAVGQQLLMLEAWRLAAESDAAGLRRLLEADLSFWRLALAESDHLIAKSLIAARIGVHFRWGNVVLKRVPEEAASEAIPPSWRRAFDSDERGLLRPFARELLHLRKGLDMVFPDSGEADYRGALAFSERLTLALLKPTLQRQDAVNRRAAVLLAVAEAFDAPVEEYPQAMSMMRAFREPVADSGLKEAFYNLAGTMLLTATASELGRHFARDAARSGDLEGLRRTALFAAEMRAAGVDDVPLALELSLPELRDPYTGQPFGWDEGSGLLIFGGLEGTLRARYVIYY